MTEKTMRFRGKERNLGELAKRIDHSLVSDGYQTQTHSSSENIIIQAKKEGVLRDIIAANRAFTIMISGEPNDFTVRIGIGKFIQNLAVAAVETLVVSELFLAVDVPEMLWTKVVEDGISKDIVEIVGSEPTSERGIGLSVDTKMP